MKTLSNKTVLEPSSLILTFDSSWKIGSLSFLHPNNFIDPIVSYPLLSNLYSSTTTIFVYKSPADNLITTALETLGLAYIKILSLNQINLKESLAALVFHIGSPSSYITYNLRNRVSEHLIMYKEIQL